jgi:poly-gamma-glutamate synthesis protein (capsule biosynthesis protein)
MTENKITLVGDVMIGRSFNNIFSKEPNFNIWGNTKKHIKTSDLFIFNLETTLTNSKTKAPKVFNYSLSPLYVKILKGLSLNMFCSIANNHILDFKNEGMIETKKILRNLKINHTGAGSNLKEAQQLVITKIKGTVFGFLSAANHYEHWRATETQGGIWFIDPTNFSHVKNAFEIVRKSKKKCDFLIFSCHMQSNYVNIIDDSIKKFYRQLIENGVDVVHGHSPHHVLQIEEYNNKVICYSLGDFVDDYAINSTYRNDLGVLIDLHIKGDQIVKIDKKPTKIENFQVNFLLSGNDYDFVMRNLNTNDKEINFMISIMNNDIETVKKHIKGGINLSILNNTPLLIAVDCGNIKIVDLLLKSNKVNPFAQNNLAMVLASKNGYTNILKMLISL